MYKSLNAKIIMVGVLLAILLFIPTKSFSEVISVKIKGIDDGVRTNKQKDYKEAVLFAKREAIERAGVKIKSITKVKDLIVEQDYIEAQAKAVLLPGYEIIDIGYTEDGSYQVVLVGKISVVKPSNEEENKIIAKPHKKSLSIKSQAIVKKIKTDKSGAGKNVCGMVEGVWTEADGPYTATCSLLIPQEKTLTIEEGVKVFFKRRTGVKIKGGLFVQGSKSKKVLFSTNEDEKTTYEGHTEWAWNGVQLDSGSTLNLNNCIVEYASTGIDIDRKSVEVLIDSSIIKECHTPLRIKSKSKITNCIIKGSLDIDDGNSHVITDNVIEGSIMISDKSDNNFIERNKIIGSQYADGVYTGFSETHYINSGTVFSYSEGNTIKDNKISVGGTGLNLCGGYNIISGNIIKNNTNGIELGAGEVINNIIVENKGYGIIIKQVRPFVKGRDLIIKNNEIHDNKKAELFNNHSSEIVVTNNWWGTTDESELMERIVDYFDNADNGIVNFKPFLTEKPNNQ